MVETSINGKSEHSFVRVALVQLDYQPSVIIANPAIEEPSKVAEGQGITSLCLSDQQFMEQIDAMRSYVAKKYENFMQQRVKQILEQLNNRSVDLVVFPEYSIPANCLFEINKYAGKYTVVAASHTVTTETVDICKRLNIKIGTSDIGKSICPIRLKDGQWQRIDKLSKSIFEPNLKAGTIWQPISLQNIDGKDFSFALFLCVDFINEIDTNVQEKVPRDIWDKVDFGVVSSYSPILKDFKPKAIFISERLGRPIIYANVANIGGSQIYCHFQDQDYFIERNGTRALGSGDEAIVIVDLYYQFKHKPTRLPVSPTSELVALLPILPKEKFSKYHALNKKIQMTSSDETIHEMLNKALSELNGIIARLDAPSVLKAKVNALKKGLKNKDVQDLKKCLDCIFLMADEESLDDLRHELLFQAHNLLFNIISDTRVKDEDFDNISKVIKFYRHSLDTLQHGDPNKLSMDGDNTPPKQKEIENESVNESSKQSEIDSKAQEPPVRSKIVCEYMRDRMVIIPKGKFVMGDKEFGQREVTISHPFMMDKYPVTQDLYQMVMDQNLSHFIGKDRPMENITWFDAIEFCNILSKKQGLQEAYDLNGKMVIRKPESNGYRLPTEAEWEYACRANTTGDRYGELDKIACYYKNSKNQTREVGQMDANEYCLYDMLGNVWEWCWDWYGDYPKKPETDPKGPDKGLDRIMRGGCYENFAIFIRSSRRKGQAPNISDKRVGFRLVLPIMDNDVSSS